MKEKRKKIQEENVKKKQEKLEKIEKEAAIEEDAAVDVDDNKDARAGNKSSKSMTFRKKRLGKEETKAEKVIKGRFNRTIA